GHEEGGDEDRAGDQAGDVEDENAGEADDQRPAKLMDLAVPQVREEGRDERGVRDGFVRMRRVAMLAELGVTRLARRALVGAAARAEDAIGHVVSAVVAAHSVERIGSPARISTGLGESPLPRKAGAGDAPLPREAGEG